jgi:hypothetical protein
LSSNMMYSEKSMNSIFYKNPVELILWTSKILWIEQNKLYQSSGLNNIWRAPYFPWTIFWRDWFDENDKFYNSYLNIKSINELWRIANNVNLDTFLKKSITINSASWANMFDEYSFVQNKSDTQINKNLSWSLNVKNISLIDTNNNIISIDSWSVLFSSWWISLNSWSINTLSWTIAFSTWVLQNLSWSLSYSDNKLYIYSWSININWNNYIVNSWSTDVDWNYQINKKIEVEDLINYLEEKLYLWQKLDLETRNKLINFMNFDKNGTKINFDLYNTSYNNTYTKWLIQLMLSQPEFILKSWYNIPKETENNINPFFNNNSKLIIIKENGVWLDTT